MNPHFTESLNELIWFLPELLAFGRAAAGNIEMKMTWLDPQTLIAVIGSWRAFYCLQVSIFIMIVSLNTNALIV
jgi:hypothetical protein